jgi:hypothetical protein
MIRWLEKFFHDKLGWHVPGKPGYFDGCSIHARCIYCGKEIMMDGQGNWFVGGSLLPRVEGRTAAARRDADGRLKDEIIVRPSPSADTRSADHIITEEELSTSTKMHIEDVRRGMDWIAQRIQKIGARHDWTKVEFFQDFYRQFRKAQETGEWGVGWYDEIHIVKERHHLEDRCPDDVTLLDVLERIVDGVMAGMARSGMYEPRPLDREILERAYMNTQMMLAKVVRVLDDLPKDGRTAAARQDADGRMA